MEEGEEAVEDYKKFLKAGCSDYPIEILKLAGVDMAKKEPVELAMKMFEKLLDEFEELKFSYTSFRNIPFFAYTAVSITTIDGEISFLSENDTITEAKLGIVAFVVIIGIIVSVIIAWCAVLVWLRRTPKKKEMNSFVLSNKTNN